MRRREGFAIGPDHADRAKRTDRAINTLERRRSERGLQRTHALSVRQLVESGHQPRAVDPQSNAFIDFIGRTRTLHPDFGPPPYGIPYVGVGGSQPRMPVTFVDYGSESDAGFRRRARLSDSGRGADAAQLHRGRRGRRRHERRSPPDHRRSRSVGAVRAVRDAMERRQRWEAGSGAVFDLRPTRGGRKDGRRPMPRAWRSCPASCATTKPRAGRSATRSASPCARRTATSGRRRIAPARTAARCRWARGCG